MKLNIDIDTSRNTLSVTLMGMKQGDYSVLASEVFDRAKELITHLPEHTPADDPKCDEFGNVLSQTLITPNKADSSSRESFVRIG